MTTSFRAGNPVITESLGARIKSGAKWRLIGLYGSIALLHLFGGGLLLIYAADYPALVGLSLTAYLLGLRHAFDADHIAAVDDTVRYLMARGQRPLGVGFFFSLGHSSIVFALAIVLAVVAGAIKNDIPALQQVGGLVGASVSGAFLWLIGALNLFLLLDMLKIWKIADRERHQHEHIETLLQKRGLMNRLLGPRFKAAITRSWQMYPVGLLFGLGFDTASEVALLAMTAGAATGALPVPAILALPLLFTAGMTLMDTTDGILMVHAYNWAFVNPIRRIFYNLFTTGVSVALALIVGSVELAQVAIDVFGLQGALFDWIANLDFATLGYYVVGLLLIAWGLSAAVWRLGGFERRVRGTATAHEHLHWHADGTTHSHRHFHRDSDG